MIPESWIITLLQSSVQTKQGETVQKNNSVNRKHFQQIHNQKEQQPAMTAVQAHWINSLNSLTFPSSIKVYLITQLWVPVHSY